jgi:imidazolonepropionase-like amidohydrolase/ABC-type multidrug transport system permease subunit
MNAYLAQMIVSLKLTYRDRTALFFSYAFPLIFFFMFAGLYKAERGGAIVQVLTMVLTIGILGAGFFGAGIRSVQEREQNILRRFKVAPITAAPMLIASIVVGLCTFLPSAVLMTILSERMYGMPWPHRWLSLFVYMSIGVITFRSIGLIIASVVNSVQESQILVQVLYFPMLMLSGATIPLTFLPTWLQQVAQFIPSTYLIAGMQGILGQDETFWQNLWGAGALILTTLAAFFISIKLFRWEKEEKLPASSKLWILAALAPFLVAGVYQYRSNDNIAKSKELVRAQRRGRTYLIRNVRIFVGNGQVIETGSVLVKAGKIEQVYSGDAPDPKSLNADVMEGSGKTVLPGLIDVHVHLGPSGGLSEQTSGQNIEKPITRELAGYLYSGVTAAKSVGDGFEILKKLRAKVDSGEYLGAELFFCGPMFTTEGGHGTEYTKNLPQNARRMIEAQLVRTPKSPAEATQQVDQLKKDGVDGIKAILEAGAGPLLFDRMDVNILRAVASEARVQNLPIVIHTGDAKDVADALSVGTNGIEHGSARDLIGPDLFASMKQHGVAYDPTLTVIEAFNALAEGTPETLLDQTLVQQVGPAKLIASTRAFLNSKNGQAMREQMRQSPASLEKAKQNLVEAWRAGVLLVTGTDAGNPLVWHGPSLHRELQLWVEAGIPPQVALQAATYNAARLLRADQRVGLVKKGYDATLLLINGDPLKNIRETENIQSVIFKGERVDRPGLFDQQ